MWDRAARRLHERTVTGRGAVGLAPGPAAHREPELELDVELDEEPGIETVCPSRRRVRVDAQAGRHPRAREPAARRAAPGLDGRAIVDDTAAYYPRHTALAVGGRGRRGRPTGGRWPGTSSPASMIRRGTASERCGSMACPTSRRRSPSPPTCARVGELRFTAEARAGARREPAPACAAATVSRSGPCRGALPGRDRRWRTGLGVMEDHDVWW